MNIKFVSRFLSVVMLAALPFAAISAATAQTAPAVAPSADLAARKALLSQYVTPKNYGGLYNKVLAQYAGFIPAAERDSAHELAADANFRNAIFSQLQTRAANAFTLPELQALARFIESDAGSSISQKANIHGIALRNAHFSESEKQALRSFSQTEEGRSIAAKGVAFSSGALSDVLKSLLVQRALQGGIQGSGQ